MGCDFEAFEFIDSFRTLCPLKDIAGQRATSTDAADIDIMDGFACFWMWWAPSSGYFSQQQKKEICIEISFPKAASVKLRVR